MGRSNEVLVYQNSQKIQTFQFHDIPDAISMIKDTNSNTISLITLVGNQIYHCPLDNQLYQ